MAPPPKRLLWVDDEIDLLRPHLLFMQGRGYHVDAASNGDDAIELVRLHGYDLILLDEQMPGRTGMEVFDEIRRMDARVPVVMVTKSEEDRTMTEAIGRRVADYLVKPTSPRQVLSVVTRLLEGGQIQQQAMARDFSARFRELNAEVGRHPRLAGVVRHLLRAGGLGAAPARRPARRGCWRRWRRCWTTTAASSAAGCATTTATGPRGEPDRPPLSVDIVPQYLAPLLGKDRTVLFVDHRLPAAGPVALAGAAAGADRAGGRGAVLLHPPHGHAVLAQRHLQRAVPRRAWRSASPAGGSARARAR